MDILEIDITCERIKVAYKGTKMYTYEAKIPLIDTITSDLWIFEHFQIFCVSHTVYRVKES